MRLTNRPRSHFFILLFFAFSLSAGSAHAQLSAPNRGDVIISEFRMRGPNGETDEFIELYNNTDQNITVSDNNPTTCITQGVFTPPGPVLQCGWAIVDVYGGTIPRVVIPQNEVIPARGHYLIANSGDGTSARPGYSLRAYATPDLEYTPPAYPEGDFIGLALFKTADRQRFNQDNQLDAVGFDGINSLYREGNGLQPNTGITEDVEFSFVRVIDKTTNIPIDTDNNSTDFVLISTSAGTNTLGRTGAVGDADGPPVLGAPGPENSGASTLTVKSPVDKSSQYTTALFDTSRTAAQSPNRCYDSTAGGGSAGSLFIRRNFTNNSGTSTQLRFRVVDITTVNSAGSTNTSQSIVKPVTSSGGTTNCPNSLSNGTAATVQDTILESPSPATGGGLNSTLSTTPIPTGQNRNVLFRLAADRTGSFRFLVVIEAR